MTEIILASQSPRRRHLLGQMGVEFTVYPSGYDEKLDDSRGIEDVAAELALGKAMDVARRFPGKIIIGSDTIVGVNDRQLEKPVDIDDARRMLESYAGRESVVTTGLAVVYLDKNITLTGTDTTKVYFNADSPEIARLREEYLSTGDWADKAGGYGIQSVRDTLIERIEGEFDTVVGLPTRLLSTYLVELGVESKPVTVVQGSLYDN